MTVIENLQRVNIEDEMRTCYIDYAMSVIVGRALPDVRDGLKPVHRRILYAMRDLGLLWNRPPKKSARLVGEVLGKYHPHGDTAVYDAIVRMVQDFSLRYPLINGQGNFGSVDGDSAAAMRYTEVRMATISEMLLVDIEKETVDFADNFDASLKEPLVLPSKLPNLLVNGSTGIAVGMATNIPPHNLTEIINGLLMLIENPDYSVIDLMAVVKGPDFPTGGTILGRKGIKDAFTTGRGSIKVRSKTHFEEMSSGRNSIIVTELPYQVNKANLISRMADLVKDKVVPGISDLRDESDRDGMRIVIELKRNENGEIVLNQLFKHTALQSSFGVIMLALVKNQPRVLDLKQVLTFFLNHRQEVIVRRTLFDLRKSEERAHILQGLMIALDNLDRIIQLIRNSSDTAEAKIGLISEFKLSEIQATAILDMRLHRLTGLERKKIENDLNELLKYIASLKEILGNDKLIFSIIKDELEEIKSKFGDERRTVLGIDEGEIDIEDLIQEENVVVIVSHSGYIKRNSLQLYRMQKRRGQGARGITTKEEDFVEHIFLNSTHSYILFFSDMGKAFSLKTYQIPEAGRQAKGTFLSNLLTLEKDEKITTILPVQEFSDDYYLILATKKGIVKRTKLSAFSNVRHSGIRAVRLNDDDSLITAEITDGNSELMLATRNGKAVRFHEDQLRIASRTSGGVRGIRLREDNDGVVGMIVVEEGSAILTVTENGFGKRTDVKMYTTHYRGGQGMKNIATSKRNGYVVGVQQVKETDSIMLISDSGSIIWIPVNGISCVGRSAQGVRLQRIGDDERLTAVAKLAEEEV